ncbi:AraC family transcriptional regulator [Halobacillus naozhouensis]|uniref:AraC family transcriptional regulator n=1 Tax=Halobacillus naozhouensis TaxID=554880 RepID=A0ABY8IYE6_9BACI|nr:AraC family transcriptional regulator [Halobacillus naozhouensis]WFT75240.1 AraC family transcriptional regulator [Halobacillus naozhouensis]
MGWVESLQQTIDYIEDHLLDHLTVNNIAKEANASPFHFQRVFTLLTDISIGEYIRRRRLTLAAQDLFHTNVKIIDLAFKYGYETPEAFTKAFRRQHGVSPSQARRYMGKLQSYNRLVIQVSLKGAEPMKYQVVEKEGFQVVGIKKGFSIANGENLLEIPKMWDQVNSDGTTDLLLHLNSGPIDGMLGICDTSGKSSSDEMNYWIAAAYDGKPQKGLVSLDIPASKWAVFEVHGAMPDAMQKVWKQIFSEWFPSGGYEHAGTPELEVYTADDPYSPNCYSEIWIPVK